MQYRKLQRLAGILATATLTLALTACNGGSASFDPAPPGEPPPPTDPPPIFVEQAFIGLAFNQPLAIMQPPADASRWFVVEKDGIVWEFPDDPDVTTNDAGMFVDLRNRVDSTPPEGGLLGMAFHPDFNVNGQVFLSYTRSVAGLESVISRFVIDETGALDADSEEELLTVPQFAPNHNGGHVAFGPDGLLYAGFGDGGGSGDPQRNGQDTRSLLGSIVRIDVDGDDPYEIPADNPFAGNTPCAQGSGTADCPEIFAWGFRNPWRFSFDRQTGELWVGDVGENSWEEINRVEISENYGWNHREGAHCFEPPQNCDTDNVDPVTEYSHDVGNSVTGGFVYRGEDIPDLRGFYVFGDFGSGRIWAIASASEQGVEPEELRTTNLRISSFGESDDGEIYLLHFTGGSIHRLVEGQ